MKSISVSSELATAAGGQTKPYLTTYADRGYEMGCGPPGSYAGHAHLHFTDVMWSPGGIQCSSGGITRRGCLLIVAPRTFFEASFSEPFFFLKFCGIGGSVQVPDKVIDQLFKGSVSVLSSPATFLCPWFPSPSTTPSTLVLDTEADSLLLNLGHESFLVKP